MRGGGPYPVRDSKLVITPSGGPPNGYVVIEPMPDPPRSAQAQRGETRKPDSLASVLSRPNHRGTLGLPSDREQARTIGTTGVGG